MVKTASEELEEPEGSTSSEAVRVSPPRREFGPYAGGSLSRWKGQDKVDNRRPPSSFRRRDYYLVPSIREVEID